MSDPKSYEFLYRPKGDKSIPLRRGWAVGTTISEAKKNAHKVVSKISRMTIVAIAEASPDGSPVLRIAKDWRRPAFYKAYEGQHKVIRYTGRRKHVE